MRAFADQVRGFLPQEDYIVLGTDGFGRSDTREKLRSHFEVDRYFITIASLKALCDEGELKVEDVKKAMKKYGIKPDKADPLTL